MSKDNDESFAIYIPTGFGRLGITEGDIISFEPNNINQERRICNLGPATRANFKNLISYLERLSIHATD